MAMQETGEVSHVEHLAAESDFRGCVRSPFLRRRAPLCALNASSDYGKTLPFRRREVLKVLGGAGLGICLIPADLGKRHRYLGHVGRLLYLCQTKIRP